MEKAARLAEVTVAQFCTGPGSEQESSGEQESPRPRRQAEARDSVMSLVLSVHVKAGRPLGFDEVVRVCGGRITRKQVSHASSVLCRDGDLDRVRTGVYQWHGVVAASPPAPIDAAPLRVVSEPSTTSSPASADRPTEHRAAAVELFEQLFPDGVTMTADLFADLQQWSQLTARISNQSRAS